MSNQGTRKRLTKSQESLLILVLLALAAFAWQWWDAQQAENNPPLTLPASVSDITAKLEALPVQEKLPKSLYDRKAFGTAWKDVDGNRCDTRNDILQRDLTSITYEGNSNCTVKAGTLADPYTGKTIDFLRGHGALVDIDHVVALGEASRSGAMSLPEEQREAIANDPLNLLAVDAPANRAKGDKDASEWMPPNEAFHCQYASLQVQVKDKYGLAVSPPEKAALLQALATCE